MNFRILRYDTLDSTNNLALQLARDGAAEGTVVTCEFQTKGRGRFKRRWYSPKGKGLLFSIVLRPQLNAQAASILTHLAAQSVAEVLKERFGLAARLKRPNDILVNGKKIAGILSESSSYHTRLDYMVVGIGLNLNTPRKGLLRTATSVSLETKRDVKEKHEVLTEILSAFRSKYEAVNLSRRKMGRQKPRFLQYAQ